MINNYTSKPLLFILINIRNGFRIIPSTNKNHYYYYQNTFSIRKNIQINHISKRYFKSTRMVDDDQKNSKKIKFVIPHFEQSEIIRKCEKQDTGKKHREKTQEDKEINSNHSSKNKNNNNCNNDNDNDNDNKNNESFKLDKFAMINSMTKLNISDKEVLRDSNIPEWKKQKLALKQKFRNSGWSPLRKVNREDMESIRTLKKNMPALNNSQIGHYFKISPEAVRRILKSNWKPKTLEEDEEVYDRWKKRGERIKSMYESIYNSTSNINHDSKEVPMFLSQKDKYKLYNSNDRMPMPNKQRRLLKKQKKLNKNNRGGHNSNMGDLEF